jgi:hypothetical protein
VDRLGEAIHKRSLVEALVFEITIVLGVLAALFRGFSLLAPWLLLAYADVVLIFLVALRFSAAPFSAILEAAQAGDADAMGRAVQAPARRMAMYSYLVLVATLVFVMVVKPLA